MATVCGGLPGVTDCSTAFASPDKGVHPVADLGFSVQALTTWPSTMTAVRLYADWPKPNPPPGRDAFVQGCNAAADLSPGPNMSSFAICSWVSSWRSRYRDR